VRCAGAVPPAPHRIPQGTRTFAPGRGARRWTRWGGRGVAARCTVRRRLCRSASAIVLPVCETCDEYKPTPSDGWRRHRCTAGKAQGDNPGMIRWKGGGGANCAFTTAARGLAQAATCQHFLLDGGGVRHDNVPAPAPASRSPARSSHPSLRRPVQSGVTPAASATPSSLTLPHTEQLSSSSASTGSSRHTLRTAQALGG
jgi:hypothetical protein